MVIEGDDIYDDGVNVAARLQELADPGGVCMAGTVFEQVGRRAHRAARRGRLERAPGALGKTAGGIGFYLALPQSIVGDQAA